VIPEIGHSALWLAAGLAFVQAMAPFWQQSGLAVALPAAVAQGFLCLLAFASLTWAFLVSDFSVELVAANSHTAKPTLYKLTGVWANHEGSMLLWVTILALFGGVSALTVRSMGDRFRMILVAAQGMLALGFYAFLLLASNPFARIAPAPVEGSGLNPLLQDPGLAFHPPLLYLGYVGLSVTFAFAVAALFDNRVDRQWARMMRPWVLAAWSFLTAGITLGSFWAYYELGWGGWWFWDPVENASLMPWLAATALFHSAGVLAARGALRNWTVLLAIVAFSLSMLGTFIVRSGLLTSVHAFAVDPTRGIFLLVLLTLYVGGALGVYALRAGTVTAGGSLQLVSREGALVANNLILSAVLGVVIVGTLYPLLLDALAGRTVSVGKPYFETALLPLLLPLLLLMGLGPLLHWRSRMTAALLRRMLPMAGLALAAGLVGLAFGLRTPLAIAGVVLAAWLAAASLAILVRRKLRHTPAATWGLVLAHCGVAVMALGITVSSARSVEVFGNLAPGEALAAGPFRVVMLGVEPAAGPNFTALRGNLELAGGAGPLGLLLPEKRSFSNPPNETTETDIHVAWQGNLYAALGDGDGSGRWQVRLHWQPLVALIWYGGLMAALGGLMSVWGSTWPLRRARAA
jgi:cytochrome c-type biogenesis protein CcmF